jgi:hypothetical protein
MNIKENYLKNANRWMNEQREVFTSERIESIVQEATSAFFAKVAELVPEAISGDFSPMDTLAFEKSANLAVRTWINSNIGNDDPVM